MDALARELGMDPLTSAQELHHGVPAHDRIGLTVDSGDYRPTLDKCSSARLRGIRREQEARGDRGDTKHIGVGLSTYIEMCGLAPSRVLAALKYIAGGWDAATIRFQPTGTVRVLIGTSPHGQGHVTTFSQIVADQLGVDVDDVEVLHGDTRRPARDGHLRQPVARRRRHRDAPRGREDHRQGAHARRPPARVSEDDLEFAGGDFTVKGTPDKSHDDQGRRVRGLDGARPARRAWSPASRRPTSTTRRTSRGPSGAHAAWSRSTPRPARRVIRYVAVDDCGVVINPLVVEGQVHGGVAQGIAEALFEEAVYDEDGNLLTATMTTYMVPRPPRCRRSTSTAP